MRPILYALSVLFAMASAAPTLAGSELVNLDVRPGVSMKMMILEPDTKPKRGFGVVCRRVGNT